MNKCATCGNEKNFTINGLCLDCEDDHQEGDRVPLRPGSSLDINPMVMAELGIFLTMPEVAKILRISESQAYTMVREKQISAVHIGRNVRVKLEYLEKYIEKQIEKDL